jgi:glycosyltransferase involved in cell wall biosynthesis
MSVDVFIPTLNSQRTIEDSLRSLVYAGVPVNQVLLVDGFSRDYTVQVVKRFCEYMNWGFKVLYAQGGLGQARYLGNLMVETPLYVSLDSDVLLPMGWFHAMEKELTEDRGLIYAGSYLVFGEENTMLGDTWRFYLRERNTQPCICAALIRRSLADFTVMRGIHVGEDTIYNFHLLETGGRYKLRHDLPATHPSTILRDMKHSYGWGRGSREIGRHGGVEFARVARAAFKGIKASIVYRRPTIAIYMPLRECIHLAGYFTGVRRAREHTLREELNLIFQNRVMVKAKRRF